jgi:hypothetical protein
MRPRRSGIRLSAVRDLRFGSNKTALGRSTASVAVVLGLQYTPSYDTKYMDMFYQTCQIQLDRTVKRSDSDRDACFFLVFILSDSER